MHSNCVWISYMAQLDTPAAVRQYRDYLQDFARQRFSWPPNIRLRDVMAWLAYQQVVRSGLKVLRLVGAGLLLVCLVDTIDLVLAKFMRRAPEIGIRRALGATRANILHYFQTENLIIAGGGCIVGAVLAIVINLMLMRMFPMERMPLWYVAAGIAVVLALGQLAVFSPARRASNVPPVEATRSV